MLWTLSCNNLPLGHISKDRVLGPELESMETTILSPLLFIVNFSQKHGKYGNWHDFLT